MWNTTTKLESADKNVMKFVFESDSAVAEAVLYKYPAYADRTVICCSTQSGCPMGCSFCGTGKQFVRNLTTDEILSQVYACLEHTGVDANKMGRLQLMFMSMGEPMLNWKALSPALKALYDLYPNAELLISTSGPDVPAAYEDLFNLSIEIPTIGVQFSVHESLQEERNKLIPFKRKLSLYQIATCGDEWAYRTGRKPFFNYCIHDNNSSDQDVERLAELFDPSVWNATISVICEADETVTSSIKRQSDMACVFSGKMVFAGFDTRVFNPAGQDDIGGGCGQLWHTQKWMQRHASKTRATRG